MNNFTRLFLVLGTCAGLLSGGHPAFGKGVDTGPDPDQDQPFKGKISTNIKDSTPDWPAPVRAPEGAPNVVVILLDDVGFGAAGTFGGAAQTPTLDSLASQGLRYNNFHTVGVCSPTRASLLTGRNHHQVGFGYVTEAGSGFPSYNGIWKKSAASIAKILNQNGYATAAFGKWHNTPKWEITPAGPFDRWPTGLGFEYYYGFQSGSTSQWEPALYENTVPVEPSRTPAQGYHLTIDLVDKAISWLHTQSSQGSGRPYFLYFATGAIHEPNHVPKEWIEKYRGKFDQGWDKLREEIFVRQKKLGVIPENTKLTERPAELLAWDSLSGEEKKFQARRMEIYAAFLAHTDHEIGRLLKTVHKGPNGDNTLVLYIIGDNGANATTGSDGKPSARRFAALPEMEKSKLLGEMGGVLQRGEISAGWAWATESPFKWMKEIASHFGGTRNPMVVSWPRRIKNVGGLRSQFTHVNDVAATLLEAAGINFPEIVDGVKQIPLDGVSFVYSFDNSYAPTRHQTQYFELTGNRAIYRDGWIATARHGVPWLNTDTTDFDHDRWELYHVSEDFSEADDLATKFPEKLKHMQSLFDIEARRNHVYPLINMESYKPKVIPERLDTLYYPDVARIPSPLAPNFLNSHLITAHAEIPPQGAEGVIIAYGGRYGGFSLYIKDERLVYENNYLGHASDTITSTIPVPKGKVVLGYEFIQKGKDQQSVSGTGRLYINGQLAGQGDFTHVDRAAYFDTMSIGKDLGSPVTESYQAPFKFSGNLKNVRVQIK